jgi:hypothetical protein
MSENQGTLIYLDVILGYHVAFASVASLEAPPRISPRCSALGSGRIPWGVHEIHLDIYIYVCMCINCVYVFFWCIYIYLNLYVVNCS